MFTYLEQLNDKAAILGLTLEDVCAREGVAASTLTRWRTGHSNCREGTAKKLFIRMDQMADQMAG